MNIQNKIPHTKSLPVSCVVHCGISVGFHSPSRSLSFFPSLLQAAEGPWSVLCMTLSDWAEMMTGSPAGQGTVGVVLDIHWFMNRTASATIDICLCIYFNCQIKDTRIQAHLWISVMSLPWSETVEEVWLEAPHTASLLKRQWYASCDQVRWSSKPERQTLCGEDKNVLLLYVIFDIFRRRV